MMRLGRAVLVVTALLTGACALAAQQPSVAPYPHRTEPIGTVRQMYDGALTPDLAVNTFRNIDRLFPTALVPKSDHPLPLPPADKPLGDITFTDRGRSYTLDQYLDLNRVAGLLVL